MAHRGKAKGNAFESRMSKELSRWLTAGEESDQLIPSRSSGGWSGGGENQGWRHVGDLAPNGPEGERFRRTFAVECKHHKLIDLWHLFTAAPADNILGWWYKLVGEIQALPPGERPEPLLIIRQNHKPIMIGIPSHFLRLLPPDIRAITYPAAGFALIPMSTFLEVEPSQYFDHLAPANG